MKGKIITDIMMEKFREYLWRDEKSEVTIRKYLHDVKHFVTFTNARDVNKELVLLYKGELGKTYAVTSANSMLAALNAFFRFAGWDECCVKQFKVQKRVYCLEEKELTKEEYIRLLEAARKRGNERLYLILQTVCSMGLRIGELQYVTVEAVCRGEAVVSCKNKTRTIFIVSKLQRKLRDYAKEQSIVSGSIFVTKNGNPVNRCNVWREMKELCAEANVREEKVFPHNLRHLFARKFYGIEKDIAKLADILGHTSIDTTRIYIMTTGVEHRQKMEQMHLIT